MDELLLKLQAVTLPLLIAVVAAGAGFATTIDRVSVSRWVVVGLCVVAAVTVVGLGLLAFFAGAPGYRNGRWWLRLVGLIPFLSLAAFIVVWAGFVVDRDPASFSLSGPVLVLGGFWLLLLYLLDRCYYGARLDGAEARADALAAALLEQDGRPSAPSMRMTRLTSLLPLALYFVPILVLINAGLAVIAFGGEEKADASCAATVTLGIRNGQLALGLDASRPAELANCIGAGLPLLPLLQPGNR